MKQWYEELFENYAEAYDRESFTHGTLGEVDFLEKELEFDKTKKILDLGCGTGRHSIELSKRGYSVIGVDYSDAQLSRARKKTADEGLKIDFILMDARELKFNSEFDLVFMICEGAFPLMETDEMNFQILQNAKKALTSNGKLILTTLNAFFPLFHSVKDFLNSQESQTKYDSLSFDLMTLREHSTITITDDSGVEKTISCSDRYYTPSEITWYLSSLGFKNINIYGCKLGQFSRNDALTVEDFEMLVVATF